MFDYEVHRCTRHCAKTERELGEGELFYTVLRREGAEYVRADYCLQAWEGGPEGDDEVVAWWKSQMPSRSAKQVRMAPNEALLHFFHDILDQPDREDMRYVLALLLVRRRVLRLDETLSLEEQDEEASPPNRARRTVPQPDAAEVEESSDAEDSGGEADSEQATAEQAAGRSSAERTSAERTSAGSGQTSETDENAPSQPMPGEELLQLYDPREEKTYRVRVTNPSESRINELQEELAKLLYADAE
jgi:hypothetical protein